jgi:thioredoxin reductase (NADPH)
VLPGNGPATDVSRPACPGVFAIGDVRHGSVKRVASAAGEGSMVVQSVHDYLGQLKAAAVPA